MLAESESTILLVEDRVGLYREILTYSHAEPSSIKMDLNVLGDRSRTVSRSALPLTWPELFG